MGGGQKFFFAKTSGPLALVELGALAAEVLNPRISKKESLKLADAGEAWVELNARCLSDDDEVLQALSKRLDCALVHLGVHDGEMAFATLYARGKHLDAFCSEPERYAPEHGKTWGGDPAVWGSARAFTQCKHSLGNTNDVRILDLR